MNAPDERRFSRTVRPQQSDAFPSLHIEVQSIERRKITKAFSNAACPDNGLRIPS
jgi:hypothetical protein